MGSRPAAPWRRLAPLTGVVLAAHVLLLRGGPPDALRPASTRVAFNTRTIAPSAPSAEASSPPREEVPPSPPWGEGRGEGHAHQPSRSSTSKPSRRTPQPAPQPSSPHLEAATSPAAPPAPAPAPAPAPTPDTAPAPEAPSTSTSTSTPAPAAAPASAAPEPRVSLLPSMHLHYTIDVRTHGFHLSGRATLDWQRTADTYDARLEMRSLGLRPRIQRSTGAVTPQGLAPSYFSDQARNEQAVHFDRDHDRLVFSNNRPDAPIAAGMQDRLSVVLQLAALLAGDPARYPPGTQIVVPTASARDAEDWVFVVEGEDDLDLPGGREPAVKLQRLPRKEYDQQVELWLAPRRDYAPLRLRLTNPNGDAADLRWSSTDRP